MKNLMLVLFLSALSAAPAFAEGSPLYDAKGLEVANPVAQQDQDKDKVRHPPIRLQNYSDAKAVVSGTQDPTPAEDRRQQNMMAIQKTCDKGGKSGGDGGCSGGTPMDALDKQPGAQTNPVFQENTNAGDMPTHHGTRAIVNGTQDPTPAERHTSKKDKLRTDDGQAQGSQGLGLGFESGSATVARGPRQTTSLDGSWPHSVQLEYFNVGKNPTQGGRGYGLTVDRITFSGVDGSTPQMALEARGMNGWQIIGASDKRPVMFHFGVEPTNIQGQVTTHIVSDARNTAARIAQSKDNIAGTTGGLASGAAADQVGDPNAPVTREQWLYYIPSVSAGLEVRKLGCRFLGLVRGGAAGGGQLHAGQAENLKGDNAYSYGVAAAYGAGAYVNCAQFDVVGEWTRIAQSGSPIDVLNADVMVKPFKNLPLALGAELGSTVVNSRDPKDVPLAFPGYGTKGASVETHAGATVRVVF